MFRYFAVAIFIGVAACASVEKQRLDRKQMERAEQLVASSPSFKRAIRELAPGAHGIRGFDMALPLANRVVMDDPRFSDSGEELLHGTYCYARAIVVAKAAVDYSEVSPGGGAVLTVSKFLVIEVLKPGDALNVGQTLHVVRMGGEVDEGDKRLRVRVLDAPAHEQASEYLLVLGKPIGGDAYVQWNTIPVGNAQLLSRWEKFRPKDSLQFVRQRLGEVSGKAPCRRPAA